MKLRLSQLRARTWLFWAVVFIAAGWGTYFSLSRYHLKRFQEVHAGVFYRVGQPTEVGLRHLVHDYHVRTVVSLQLYDYRLYRGMVDPFGPSGMQEAEYVTKLGAKMVQWPMGDEACWPWLTPWELEAFFQLIDEPANLPVAIHCMGGRHRTGTLAAIFRMEYDRWTPEQACQEMHSFSFGECVQMQEANLRTYLPRPHPDAATWKHLNETFAPLVGSPRPQHYEELVRRLRAEWKHEKTVAAVSEYLERREPFALPLMQRLVDRPNDALATKAATLAAETIAKDDAPESDYQMAAAMVADFGTVAQQQRLLALLEAEIGEAGPVSRRYAALAAGLGNRYTTNRVPYFATMLLDKRPRAEPAAQAWRYCDVAVARLSAITDRPFLRGLDRGAWDEATASARQWLASNPRIEQLSQVAPPTGHKLVKPGDGSQVEDLSRLKSQLK